MVHIANLVTEKRAQLKLQEKLKYGQRFEQILNLAVNFFAEQPKQRHANYRFDNKAEAEYIKAQFEERVVGVTVDIMPVRKLERYPSHRPCRPDEECYDYQVTIKMDANV